MVARRGKKKGREGRLNEKIVARCIFICVITLAHFQTTISACWQLWPGGRDSFTERAQKFSTAAAMSMQRWAVGGGWWGVSGWSCRWRRV